MKKFINPWMGPESYPIPSEKKQNPSHFCGRKMDTIKLSWLIKNNTFVTLYGLSGVGKTSLIKAGVYPYLGKENYKPVFIRLYGTNSNHSFARCILKEMSPQLADDQDFQSDESEYNEISFLWKQLEKTYAKEHGVIPIIMLDQFEEILRHQYDDTVVLLQQIYYVMNKMRNYGHPFCHFIISIREDDFFLLEDCIDNNSLFDMKNYRYRLHPLDSKSPEGAKEVINIPGEKVLPSDENEKEELIKKIILLSSNPEDSAISTITLSMVCYMLYIDMIREERSYISLKNYMDDNGELIKNNLFEEYYYDVTKELDFPKRTRIFLEDELVQSGRRVAIPLKRAKEKGVIGDVNKLLESDRKLLNLNGDRIELIHDTFCSILTKTKMLRERDDERQRRKLQQRLYEIESIFLVEEAKELLKKGEKEKACLLALEALPKDLGLPSRPYAEEAANGAKEILAAARNITPEKRLISPIDIIEEELEVDSPDSWFSIKAKGNEIIVLSKENNAPSSEADNRIVERIMIQHDEPILSLKFSKERRLYVYTRTHVFICELLQYLMDDTKEWLKGKCLTNEDRRKYHLQYYDAGEARIDHDTDLKILEKLIKQDMVDVEGGEYIMGTQIMEYGISYPDEFPSHKVKLDSFRICRYQVTQELWELIMGTNPSKYPGAQRPVENVSWEDCLIFIDKLNAYANTDDVIGTFRLPTEAEWEYAARGGNNGKSYKYSGSDNIDQVAWYKENSYGMTHPVGQKNPNELGLYDMSGNVSEWCLDGYNKYHDSVQINPVGECPKPENDSIMHASRKVLRGGAYHNGMEDCRVSYRDHFPPTDSNSHGGLRLAMSIKNSNS